MTDSAERPLIGPETDCDTVATDSVDAGNETSLQDDSIASAAPGQERTGPRWRADADDRFHHDEMDDDGPVIRRIRSPHTPGMFSSQMGPAAGHDPEEFDLLAAPPPREREPVHNPAPRAHYTQPQTRNVRRHEHEEFSVAAIREKRMRRPAGTHTPTRLGTKLTVAALASVCLMSAGVALGLYGQDIGRVIEQQARTASAAVNGAIGQVASATVTSLDQGSGKNTGADGGGNDRTAAATPEATLEPAAAATGRKLIYKRLPTANDNTASAPDTQREVRAATAASLGGLEQLLAPPADFAPGTRALD